MKKIICFLFFVFLSCSQKSYESSDKQRHINHVRHEVAKKIAKETALVPFGTTGQALNQIEKLGLSFLHYGKLDDDHARSLLIKVGYVFIDEVNGDENIRPYLANFPFNLKNIEVRIFIKDELGRDLNDDNIQIVTLVDGVIEYNSYSSKDKKIELVKSEKLEDVIEMVGVR